MPARMARRGARAPLCWAGRPRNLCRARTRAARSFLRVSGSTFNGSVVGLPVANVMRHLLYRRDVLAKAGLSPPNTWRVSVCHSTIARLIAWVAAAHSVVFLLSTRWPAFTPLPSGRTPRRS